MDRRPHQRGLHHRSPLQRAGQRVALEALQARPQPMYMDGAYCAWMPPTRSSAWGRRSAALDQELRASSARFSARSLRTLWLKTRESESRRRSSRRARARSRRPAAGRELLRVDHVADVADVEQREARPRPVLSVPANVPPSAHHPPHLGEQPVLELPGGNVVEHREARRAGERVSANGRRVPSPRGPATREPRRRAAGGQAGIHLQRGQPRRAATSASVAGPTQAPPRARRRRALRPRAQRGPGPRARVASTLLASSTGGAPGSPGASGCHDQRNRVRGRCWCPSSWGAAGMATIWPRRRAGRSGRPAARTPRAARPTRPASPRPRCPRACPTNRWRIALTTSVKGLTSATVRHVFWAWSRWYVVRRTTPSGDRRRSRAFRHSATPTSPRRTRRSTRRRSRRTAAGRHRRPRAAHWS